MARKNKKLVYGIGINDADYVVVSTINGKRVHCKFYDTWNNMLERCYSEKCQKRQPTYIGCSVVEEWHYFMNFKRWMEKQDWENKQLDKDIILPGNKIYSPNTCVFVTSQVNKLLTNRAASRGKYPQGVYYNKCSKKFVAKVRLGTGAQKHLGYFNTIKEAEIVYKKEKIKYIMEIANEQTDKRIAIGLAWHAAHLHKELQKEL